MANNKLPDPPAQLKAIQSFMKVSTDIERVDPVVSYWLRLYSTDTALKIDKDSSESKKFLGALIVWLENFKQTHKENDAVSNQIVGQAHYENFALSLFNKVHQLDLDGTANKTTVMMFYMAAVLFEGMAVFGPITEEINKQKTYAKFKAAYIQKCLKTGKTPKPGPVDAADLEGGLEDDQPSQDPPLNRTDVDKSSIKPADEVPKAEVNKPQAPDPFILSPSPAPVFPPARPNTSVDYTPSKPAIPTQPPVFDSKSPAPGSANTSCNTSLTTSLGGSKLHAIDGTPLDHEHIIKTQKYCKFANSALQYDDISTAVQNLEKALRVLKTGQDVD